MRESNFYHVCSEGLEKRVIFRNRREFIIGMNYIAICIQKCNVTVVCFCLMSNHFHFILRGSHEECLKFGREYKRMCAMLMKRAQDVDNAMKNLEIMAKEINDRSYLEYAIAYVLRNPIVAGFKIMPHQYPWSSGNMYFRNSYIPVGREAKDFNVKELQHQVLYSKTRIPENYKIDENGMVSPLCYTDYRSVEELFGHPSRLMGLLSTKKESEFEIFLGIAEKYNPDIEELRDSVRELIQAEFSVKAVSQLSIEQKIKLCTLMRRNFNASRKQISMITRLNLETVCKIV